METQQSTGSLLGPAEHASRSLGRKSGWPGESGGRRRRIIAATVQVIGREGIGRFTLRKVAREARVDLAGLYRLFSTKEALMLAALEEVTSMLIAAVTIAADPHKGLRATLTSTISTLCVLSEQPPHQLQVRCELLLHTRHTTTSQLERATQRRRLGEELAAIFQNACDVADEQSAVPVVVLAELLIGGAVGFAIQGVPADAERACTCDELLRAMLALVEDTTYSGSLVRQTQSADS